MDVLTDVVQLVGAKVRIHGSVSFDERTRFVGDSRGLGAVYGVSTGSVCVDRGTDDSINLKAGDALFLMKGESSLVRAPGESEAAEAVVGRVEFAIGGIDSEIVDWPEVLHLRAAVDASGLVARLADEVRHGLPGWEAVANGLANSLLVIAIRSHHAPGGGCPAHGWLRGLADPEVGLALQWMHQQPAQSWTVAELANRLAMSRSAFAARFKQVTGRPPLDYLTWWRLRRAAARLRLRDGATVAQVAREVGYKTEAAFGKAFRRQFGRTPGQVRREGAGSRRETPLQVELKKRNPFEVREQEVAINLIRSAAKISADFVELLAPHRINSLQYNVLRILRGEGASLPLAEVQSRRVTLEGDLKDHVARLISAGLLESDKSERLLLTARGDKLLAMLDGPVIDLHRRQLAHFSPEELVELNRLLVKARRTDQ